MSNNPFASGGQPQQQQYGYQAAQQQPQMTGYPSYQQTPAYIQPQPYAQQSYASSSNPNAGGFQPSSSFGQALKSHYNTVQDLDPYSNLGVFQQQQQQQARQSPQPPAVSPNPITTQHNAHPRIVVENNKAALEAWNEGAWKTLLARLGELQSSWEGRRQSLLDAVDNQSRALTMEERNLFQTVRFSRWVLWFRL